MKSNRFTAPGLPWRVLAALSMAAVVVACGGGGGVDTGGTGAPAASYSSGRISGFGSIVVNGVHFDESEAAIVDDEGAIRAAGDLKLGMTVDIEAGPITGNSDAQPVRSTATRVQFGSEIKGPVEAVDTTARTLRVLGQTVEVDTNTVFAGFTDGLGDVAPSDLVEVFAFFDESSGTYSATRIERKSTLDGFKLRGPIAALDATRKTLRIGDAAISYAAVPTGQLPELQNGTIARVELATTRQGDEWVATGLHTSMRSISEGVRAEIEGHVAGFTSLARFKVKGVTVDASRSPVFTRGDSSQLVNGARIEIEGRMQAGVLVAEGIAVKKTRGKPDTEEPFELQGAIESVDAAADSFVVRGTTVVVDADTKYIPGSSGATDLVVGAAVEVKGVLAGGDKLRADSVRFSN